MSNPLVSVVIPCRNEAAYIEQTVATLLGQKNLHGNIEILVVDGMSTDGTREILSRISSENSLVKMIDNENRVTPFALNLGIKNASGDYITIMGAHAEYDSDYLSNCLKVMNDHPEVSCVGGPIISKGKNNFSKATALAMSSPIGVGNAKHRFPDYEGYAEMACFPMFRKKVFDEIGLYDESLVRNQDDEFCFRLNRSGGKVYLSPAAKSYYYVRDSIKKLFSQYYQYGYWRIAVLKKHKLPISFRQQVPALFFLTVITLIIIGLLFNSITLIFILPALYIFTLLIFSLKVLMKNTLPVALLFPVSVFVLHLSYAAGFAVGIFDFILRGKKLKKHE